jgi:hypothetical protein
MKSTTVYHTVPDDSPGTSQAGDAPWTASRPSGVGGAIEV